MVAPRSFNDVPIFAAAQSKLNEAAKKLRSVADEVSNIEGELFGNGARGQLPLDADVALIEIEAQRIAQGDSAELQKRLSLGERLHAKRRELAIVTRAEVLFAEQLELARKTAKRELFLVAEKEQQGAVRELLKTGAAHSQAIGREAEIREHWSREGIELSNAAMIHFYVESGTDANSGFEHWRGEMMSLGLLPK